jgi:hypothetical protein
MDITEDEAAQLFETIFEKLDAMGARDVVEGINESRLLGIEETVVPESKSPINRAELKSLGTVRRRPPTNVELLQIALQRINQRLNVIPAIALRLEKSLGTCEIEWRVDESFIASGRAQQLETTVLKLTPDGIADVARAYRSLREFIPEVAPDSDPGAKNG